MFHVFILINIFIFIMIYSFLIFISPFYALTLIMLRGRFPILPHVGVIGVIASNHTRLVKANFGGVIIYK
jgi:hypothetical protein